MQRKSFQMLVKSLDSETGIIKFYGSTFANIDRHGDIVVRGAFLDSLERFVADGVLCWQHNWDEPIGKILSAVEDEHGLLIEAQLILSIPKARECFELMKAGVIKKFSIGFEVLESEPLTVENLASFMGEAAAAHEMAKALSWGCALKKIEIYEVSPVSIPANPKCDLTDIKSGLRDGRRFDEFAELVHAANAELVKDAAEIRALRAKEGRSLSSATRTRLQEASAAMKTACADIDALLDETNPEKGAQRARACLIEAEALEAELALG